MDKGFKSILHGIDVITEVKTREETAPGGRREKFSVRRLNRIASFVFFVVLVTLEGQMVTEAGEIDQQ